MCLHFYLVLFEQVGYSMFLVHVNEVNKKYLEDTPTSLSKQIKPFQYLHNQSK